MGRRSRARTVTRIFLQILYHFYGINILAASTVFQAFSKNWDRRVDIKRQSL